MVYYCIHIPCSNKIRQLSITKTVKNRSGDNNDVWYALQMSCDPFRHQYSVDVDRGGGCGNISCIDVEIENSMTFVAWYFNCRYVLLFRDVVFAVSVLIGEPYHHKKNRSNNPNLGRCTQIIYNTCTSINRKEMKRTLAIIYINITLVYE